MKSFTKLIFVLVLFSIFFFVLRFDGANFNYNVNVLVADLGGLTYLYSTVGTIFAVFAAFVVVSESQDWNTLAAASKNEIRELRELWIWSRDLPEPLTHEYEKAIEQYLEIVIQKEWRSLEQGKELPDADRVLDSFHDLLLRTTKQNPAVGATLFSSFNKLSEYRSTRVEYSWQPLPQILKFTVFLVDISLIILSLLIGVKNIWLDYIFMSCIVLLGSVILIVIEDLDNPLRPGDWYLSSKNYETLLSSMRSAKKGGN